jgi:hypothetical protein
MKTLLVILFGVFLFPIMGGIVEDSTVLTKNGSTGKELFSFQYFISCFFFIALFNPIPIL